MKKTNVISNFVKKELTNLVFAGIIIFFALGMGIKNNYLLIIIGLLSIPIKINQNSYSIFGGFSEENLHSLLPIFQLSKKNATAFFGFLLLAQKAEEDAIIYFGGSICQTAEKNAVIGIGINFLQTAGNDCIHWFGISMFQSAENDTIALLGIHLFQSASNDAIVWASLYFSQKAEREAFTGLSVGFYKTAFYLKKFIAYSIFNSIKKMDSVIVTI